MFPATVQKCCDMMVLKLDDSIDRFRFATSCLGLVGCLCISYSVWTPFWLADRGLWTDLNSTGDHQAGAHSDDILHNALEAEQVFGALSFLMAVSSGVLCLVFALCWTSETVRSYSNTRSLLMAGQALYPTTLLLLILVPTGFFYLLSWSVFTYQHKEQIQQDLTSLGSSYWFGALGWVLLLVVLPAVFVAEQCVVPDILPDLEKAVGLWRAASQAKSTERPFSEGCYPGYSSEGHSMDLRRFLSSP